MEKEPRPFLTKSPVVEIDIGRTALRLTYENTYLVQFLNVYSKKDEAQDFQHMNIIKHYNGEDIQNIYDSEELFEQLDKLKFPKMRYPYPLDQHLEGYSGYLIADLRGEVERGDE